MSERRDVPLARRWRRCLRLGGRQDAGDLDDGDVVGDGLDGLDEGGRDNEFNNSRPYRTSFKAIQIPEDPHWGFCYSMLHKVSRSFALIIQQLDTDLRDTVCIFYLVLRVLDTVEDDTSIAADVKNKILAQKLLLLRNILQTTATVFQPIVTISIRFNHLPVKLNWSAFSALQSNQEAIEDITMRMGAGMAKFIWKEVETIDDYDEYCHYVPGLVGLGLSKLFHASGKEDLASDTLSNSMGLFFQDLKYEENSVKAVQCLNDMVTYALLHAEDALKYMAALRDPSIFQFCAIQKIMAIGTLALCYNNIEVFRGVVKMRRVKINILCLTAKIIDRTKTMSDVYGAFYDFSRMLKSKVNDNDPNARKTKDSLEVIPGNLTISLHYPE
ncbi:squalene synthase [Phtheirospermum japonicum]|uniref:Squalene synthase n=1 Tax=Phtheirospermum japonicum TaxID=374723 RepID=A0A830D1V3_9LAMI|nr:squalene synthase [Phtheirospermum japonicum]